MANGQGKKSVLVGRKTNGRRIEADGLKVEDGKYVIEMYDGNQVWFRMPDALDLRDLEMADPTEPVMVLYRGDDEERKKNGLVPVRELYPTSRVMAVAKFDERLRLVLPDGVRAS